MKCIPDVSQALSDASAENALLPEPVHRSGAKGANPQAMKRRARSLQLLNTFTQIWQDKTELAQQVGESVQAFVMPLDEVRSKRHLRDLDSSTALHGVFHGPQAHS